MNSPLTDFYYIAGDILQLISKKAKQASVNTEAAQELETIRGFFEACEALFIRCQTDLHCEMKISATEHIKAKILEKEIRDIYNELHKKNQAMLVDILTSVKTALPTKAELMEDVIIKNQ